MIGTAIFARLTEDESTTAAVGSRVYPHEVPPRVKTYPLIVYKPGDLEIFRHHQGNLGLCRHQVTLALIATTYDGLMDLLAAVTDALDGQRGTWGGVTVQACFLDDESEDLEATHVDDQYWIAEPVFTVLYHTRPADA